MELLVILYSEEMLTKLYRIYQLHQARHDLGFMKIEDFRLLFEEQQQTILDQIDIEAETP